MRERILPRSFYTTDACTLAEACLGKVLVLETAKGILSGVICETEAYMGVIDRASHAYGGRKTERNGSMYLPGGFAYVYQIYGLYHCFNITAAVEGNPEAVLVRSMIPLSGIGLMAENRQKNGRGKRYPSPENMNRKDLDIMMKGPGRVCTAMGIDKSMNGWDLLHSPLYLADIGICVREINALPRVGIDYAGEDRDRLWRYQTSVDVDIQW